MSTTPERRTKRRYAHELYPHADEWEIRPLSVEVPYLYARFVGLDLFGTDWFDLLGDDIRRGWDRTMLMIDAKEKALLADALLQGMGGVEAWEWAMYRAADEASEIAYERAIHYGVPVRDIKPYPVISEPDHHDHRGPELPGGGHYVNRVAGQESECDECTEEVPE